ncbi:MAG TPA: hypothetical protein VMZ11_08575 [Mycobacteriales bacterium]|nr:hypothetical protein [Mycobacteriales bacterium]
MRWGERVEQNPAVQGALTVVMVVVMGCVVLWNLPNGRPKQAVRPTAGTVVQALGLEQDWALFAPNPRSYSVGVYATLTHRDGRVETWVPPHNGLLLAPYRTYRWQKYVERLRADDYSGLWEPTARWLAREHGPGVVKVVLTRTFQDAKVPGTTGPRPKLGTFDFYTLDLP